jgi:hypothetical protein
MVRGIYRGVRLMVSGTFVEPLRPALAHAPLLVIAIAAGFSILASPVQAQSSSTALDMEIPRVGEPPRLEWFMAGSNGVAHRLGAPVTDFRQRDPGDGTPVSEETTAFLSYDDDHFYAVFVCKDDPGAVRANVAKREDIDSDDAVALYLDTFHDRQRAYVVMVNPLGIQLDGIDAKLKMYGTCSISSRRSACR